LIFELAWEAEMAEVKLKSTGTQLMGVGIAGQPLCLGMGNQKGSGYVSVVTNSGNPYQWQFVILGSDGQTIKLYIGTGDGQSWWTIPGDNPFPGCVSLMPGGQDVASTIIYDNATGSLNAAFGPNGYLAPIGGPSGFYFATNNQASSPVVFFATT
jgi:hypothetical protein